MGVLEKQYGPGKEGPNSSACSWAIHFSVGLHEDGRRDEEARAVVEVSEERGRVVTPSKQDTESTGIREEEMGIDEQRRGSEVN